MVSQVVVGTNATTPTTPASGNLAIYAKTDNKVYALDSTGVERSIGGGASGSGTDAIYYANDGIVTQAVTIGVGTQASGVTFTLTNPTISLTGHGFVAGSPVCFTTTGALPTGFAVNTGYYVIATGLTADAFQVSATVGGAAITPTVSQSGTHSVGKLENNHSVGPVSIVAATTVVGRWVIS